MQRHVCALPKATVRRACRHGGEQRRVRQKAAPLEGEGSHRFSSDFFLDADSQPPVPHVTEDMSAARHTGPYMRWQVADRQEMMRLVRDGLRASGIALRLLLEQGEDGSAEA